METEQAKIKPCKTPKCYFCGCDCYSNTTITINCGNLNQSELFKAYVCDKCSEAVHTADVRLVVHAYWIQLPKALNHNENPCKCSNCGHILSFMNGYPKSKYCDDCGARMDLKKGRE